MWVAKLWAACGELVDHTWDATPLIAFAEADPWDHEGICLQTNLH